MQWYVPAIRNTFSLSSGACLLAAIIVLAIMILPSIINVSETALRAVPKEYEEAAVIRTAVQLLASIPSVVYGFFGLVVLVPLVRDLFGGSGFSLFTAALLLGIMILPTVIGVSEASINAVPDDIYYGALALGATHEKSVFTAVLPAAKSGVAAAAVLGMGRAVGETMAVTFIIGNTYQLDSASLYMPGNSITSALANEFAEAESGLHVAALMELGLILFVITFIVLAASKFMIMRLAKNEGAR